MLRQASSGNVVDLDWTLFWVINDKYIDPVAPRHTAVVSENAVRCKLVGAGSEVVSSEDESKHVKNPALSSRRVVYSSTMWIDQVDSIIVSQDEEITLINRGECPCPEDHKVCGRRYIARARVTP